MKTVKHYLLTIALIPGFAIADETGHGDPVNCAYVCAGAGSASESVPAETSLLDALLDLFTLEEETENTE